MYLPREKTESSATPRHACHDKAEGWTCGRMIRTLNARNKRPPDSVYPVRDLSFGSVSVKPANYPLLQELRRSSIYTARYTSRTISPLRGLLCLHALAPVLLGHPTMKTVVIETSLPGLTRSPRAMMKKTLGSECEVGAETGMTLTGAGKIEAEVAVPAKGRTKSACLAVVCVLCVLISVI